MRGPNLNSLLVCSVCSVSPVLQDPEAPGRHAVDAPVCDAVLVADADREPPVVCPHDLDDRPLGTLQVQPVPLTGVGCLHRSASPCRILIILDFHSTKLFSMRC